MTRPNAPKSVLRKAVGAAASGLVIQACCGNALAQAASGADAIEGVWDFAVTRKDCASGAVLGTQKALSMFQRGGAFSNANSTPPATQGATFGTWKRTSGAGYVINMVFMRFNPDGTLAGTQRVQRDMVLARDNNNITGAISAQTIDPSGLVVERGCASETAVRIF
jgi:hypothetical protein